MHYESKSLFPAQIGRVGKVALMLVILGLVTSCGKKNGDEKASQTIVRVNGDEITVLQLNNELQRANVQPGQQKEASKQIASALVDRQILMQEAHKNKLDRNPRVMQAIENAKSQILAQAYLEEKVSSLAKPTDAEIADYRAKHADIFADRKVFVMDELAFKVELGNTQDIQALSNSAKTLDDVSQWLDTHQIKHERTHATHASETLPSQLLGKLRSMVVGDLIFINANGGTVAGRMIEIKDAAIAEKDSKPIIERLIFDQKRKQVAEDEMKRLRSAAKIEYINKKFQPGMDNQTVKAVEPVVSAKPIESSKAVEKVKPSGDGKTESHIEKGLSGL